MSLFKFRRLKIARGALINAKDLRSFVVNGVGRLEIENYSLNQVSAAVSSLRWRLLTSRVQVVGTVIDVIQCHIDTVPSGAFAGSGLSKIHIFNSTVGTIKSEAFSDMQWLQELVLQGNTIENIEPQAFNNSHAQKLRLEHNSIQTIRDNAFNISTSDAAISHNTISMIQDESFSLQQPKSFLFNNNSVEFVYRHAFVFTARRVEMFNNSFRNLFGHAFSRIHPHDNSNKRSTFLFRENLIGAEFAAGALSLSNNFVHHMFQIRLQIDCFCGLDVRIDKLVSDQPLSSNTTFARWNSNGRRVARSTDLTDIKTSDDNDEEADEDDEEKVFFLMALTELVLEFFMASTELHLAVPCFLPSVEENSQLMVSLGGTSRFLPSFPRLE